MARVALVSYDVQAVDGRNGGVGSTNTHFARLLKAAGEEVTIVFANGSARAVSIDREWKDRYAAWGIRLLEVHNPLPQADRWVEAWPARLSEQIAPHLNDFDIAYLQDWANPGFHSIRRRRFSSSDSGPLLVTVLHGPSQWARAGNRKLPNVPEDLQLDFIERYSAQHSDLVIAPSQYMVDWLKSREWTFLREPEVLGIPYIPYVQGEPFTSVPAIERIIFFGRIEVRKGFDLFRDALSLLCSQQSDLATRIREIVLLGSEQEVGSVAGLRAALSPIGLTVTHLSSLSSLEANLYLAAQAQSSIVVIPSPFENFPSSVIEALSIPGLNVICSRGGGIPEVFGGPCDAQLFEPHAPALASKLAERLISPLRADQLAVYDVDAANGRWVDFHRRAIASRGSRRRSHSRPSVDVCITYYNKGPYLNQLLQALESQTEQRFGVIAIDDGSSELASRRVFDEAAAAYSHKGWRFQRQPNVFVDAARNRAAEASSAKYLLFIDADDVPARHAVERLLDGALSSGVDCLLSGGYIFDSDRTPYDVETGTPTLSGLLGYLPLGPDLVCGMIDPMVFGLPMILIRRAVFLKIGGYRECRGAGHEDWELQVRLLASGYQTDVLPERLLFFRRPADGLTMTGERFPAKLRLIDTYRKPLQEVGMPGLASVVFRLNEQCNELQEKLRSNIPLELRVQLHDRQRLRTQATLIGKDAGH